MNSSYNALLWKRFKSRYLTCTMARGFQTLTSCSWQKNFKIEVTKSTLTDFVCNGTPRKSRFNEKWRLIRFFNIAGNWLKITLLRTVATPISSVSSQSALFKIISYMLNVVCDDGCKEIFKEEKQRYRPKLPGLRLPIKTCCVCFNLLQTGALH